ncbi:unnamed protein product [Clonostachys rhizophaga]|uniref:Uncharacterized protein n=1 Tax=Clonostachys rhizophaga TaxID=160324 RepID=A0A9N9YQ11_9HYPO|nr:unnamed protein product [Clonostachys rhizophaga]
MPEEANRLMSRARVATSDDNGGASLAELGFQILNWQPAVSSGTYGFEKLSSGCIHGLSKNAAIMTFSTVPGTYRQEVRERLDEEFGRPDILLLDWSVSSGTSGAAYDTLTVFACDTDEGMALVDPVL